MPLFNEDNLKTVKNGGPSRLVDSNVTETPRDMPRIAEPANPAEGRKNRYSSC
jgi:hypothetical protein